MTVHRTLILGHRGAPLDAPENSLRGFRLAVARGADGVELDVRSSSDGEPVVIHDDTLERTTDGSGEVAATPWQEISRLRTPEGDRVPAFGEVAAWAAEAGVWLNLEFKAGGVEQACVQLLGQHGALDRTICSSFQPEVLEELARVGRPLARYLLADEWGPAEQARARDLRVDGVCLNAAHATPATLLELAGGGLPVVVWTVNDPFQLVTLLAVGVRGVISDYPAVAARARARIISQNQ